MKINNDRNIFCGYWLYFNGVRGLFGNAKILDVLAMSLLALGLIRLISGGRLNFSIVIKVSIFLTPLFVAVIVDFDLYVLMYVLKVYVVSLYFVLYLKSNKLSLVEYICFSLPLIVSLYFFSFPRSEDMYLISQGRLSGISDPNFTSLSLIYAMCGAFGIYLMTQIDRTKVAALVTVFVCFCGVVLTASRGGFIGATIAVGMFFLSGKKIRTFGLLLMVLIVIFSATQMFDLGDGPLVLQRFLGDGGGISSVLENSSARNYLAEIAWDRIFRDEWFVGGGPRRVSAFGMLTGTATAVPHNSFLDIGLAFGKASLYFYVLILLILSFMNVKIFYANHMRRNLDETSKVLSSILFLSLMPMYLSLSAGMTMHFVFWLSIGVYPYLLTSSEEVN